MGDGGGFGEWRRRRFDGRVVLDVWQGLGMGEGDQLLTMVAWLCGGCCSHCC